MITVYTLIYNEELLMQFMIDHYRSRFPGCHIVVYDNASTDNTVAVAQANNCEVRPYDTGNTMDDGIHMQIKNNCWKDAKTDWVVVCDLDELLDITADELKYEDSLGTTIFKPEGWTMVNLNDNYDFKSIKTGFRDGGYDKCVLFKKSVMANINYGAGCHQCNPVGAVKYSSKPYILHHFRDIHPDRAVSKAKLTAQRMSQTNKRNGWGFQNNRTEKEIRDDFERLRREARSQTVPVRREINHSNYFPHFYTKIQGWFNYQELYHEIVKELPDNSHIVELGAWKGCSTAFLAVEIINSGKNIKLDVVDTWKGSIDEIGHQTDPDMIKYNGDIFPLFMENIDPVKHVINPIQLPTEEAYKLYADKSLDFVFLDANHSYACVKEDIKNWLPKVKAGGVFAGHDWNHVSWPGVVQAVKESFALDKIIVIGECWVIQL